MDAARRATGWAMAAVLAVAVAPGMASGFTCPTSGGRNPASEGFCSGACTTPDAAWVDDENRSSLVLAVMDDQGYCQFGFQHGRCAAPAADTHCTQTCSNAAWIYCQRDADCPGDGTCDDADPSPPQVCSNALTTTCTTASLDCPSGGTCVDRPCRHGFYQQCVVDADCAVASGQWPQVCSDGLCSPRASCVEGGDFVCGRGRCDGGYCTNRPPGTFSCSEDIDCNDTCEAVNANGSAGDADDWLCARTPESCGPRTDCPVWGQQCTTGQNPLRLHDLSCRYRQPGDDSWQYARGTPPPAREQIVHTPTIDLLAAEGIVFGRAHVGGQKCTPGREALTLGRVLRHRNSITLGQDNLHQCRHWSSSTPELDLPYECDANNNGHCAGYGSGICDDFHTIAWWLNGGTSDPMGRLPSHRIAVGKIEVGNAAAQSYSAEEQTGKSGPKVGKFACNAGSQCAQALQCGQIPTASYQAGDSSVAPLMSEVATAMTASGSDPTKPFFAWYAPVLPHVGTNAEFFDTLYEPPGTTLDAGEKHLSRVSQFDAGLGTIIDELKRTCVCDDGTKTSLWDHTTMVVTADNAYLLPNSKNDNGQAGENAHRAALIVRPPGGTDGKVMDEQSQLAAFYDVLPTAIDYVGHASNTTPDAMNRYPLARTLAPFVDGGMSQGFVRDLFYGGNGLDDTIGDNDRAYLINRAGYFGLCANSLTASPQNHRRPCLENSDCDAADTCVMDARRCVNRPSQGCTSDAHCACDAGGCGAQACSASLDVCTFTNDFSDYRGMACTSAADCVPEGACRPVMLKAVRSGNNQGVRRTTRLYDLNWTPDDVVSQQSDPNNLLAGDPAYLGAAREGACPVVDPEDPTPPPAPQTIIDKIDCCLAEFWELRGSTDDYVWKPLDRQCPASMRQWPIFTN